MEPPLGVEPPPPAAEPEPEPAATEVAEREAAKAQAEAEAEHPPDQPTEVMQPIDEQPSDGVHGAVAQPSGERRES